MHSILLVVENSINIEIETIRQNGLHKEIREVVKSYKNTEALREGVYMIKSNDISCFVEVSALCIRAKCTYKAIFFDEEPQWVYSK